ncbi:ketopantoate reductase family protein [Xanthobacter flavus]|uniref:ketopantoate reductase family protein n=1 Tax=Xanthobacter flavus TaxID=281 RepID=UPI001AE4C066|nr:ketopantoate reductase family protein [Xanthobacter flavus]MBP2150985.1 2-dehydropantoate 2-reductase [Xanthobacter flavus]
MRILVMGAGGIGGYFGGRLAAAGVDIRFLIRPARAEWLARHGLVITSPLGDLRIPVATLTAADAPFDAVLLACKAYDLEGAMDAVAPAVGPATLVLPLLNGVRQLDRLDARFGRERVLGGLCHIGVSLTEAGEIQHLNRLQRFVLGARTSAQVPAAAALHKVLERGGFAPVLSEDVMQDMWEKFTFLATYAGMTTLMRAPVGGILSAEEGEAILRDMLAECVATATAGGHPPRPEAMAQMVASLTERGSAGTASMLRDMMRNGPTEHDHILGDMLARARAAGLSAPLLRVSLAHMQAYDATRARGAP